MSDASCGLEDQACGCDVHCCRAVKVNDVATGCDDHIACCAGVDGLKHYVAACSVQQDVSAVSTNSGCSAHGDCATSYQLNSGSSTAGGDVGVLHDVAECAQAGVPGAVEHVGIGPDGTRSGLDQQVACCLNRARSRCASIDCDVSQGADEYQLARTNQVFLRYRGRATGCGRHCCIAAHPVDCHCQGIDRHRVGLSHVSTGCACTQAQGTHTSFQRVKRAAIMSDATCGLEDQACCCDVFGCRGMTVQNTATGRDDHVGCPRVDGLQRYVAACRIEQNIAVIGADCGCSAHGDCAASYQLDSDCSTAGGDVGVLHNVARCAEAAVADTGDVGIGRDVSACAHRL